MANYRNLNNIISQISNVLTEKGISLEYSEDNSILKLFSSNSDIVNVVTEKFVNELELYKTVIFPLINKFKDEVKTESVLTRKQNTIGVPYVFFNKTKVVDHILDSICGEGKTNHDFKSNGEYLSVKIPYENYTEEEIYKLFNNTDDNTFNNYIVEVLTKFSNLELKEFIRKYCILITGSTSSLDSVSYLTLAQAPLANLDEMALVYGFVNSLKNNETPTNLPTDRRNETIKVITENIIGMFEEAKGLLNHYKENKVVTISYSDSKLGSTRFDDNLAVSNRGIITTRELNFVFEPALKELQETIQVDVIGAVLGATETVRNVSGRLLGKDITVDDVLTNQTQFLDDFKMYINLANEAASTRTINNITKIIFNVSEKLYDSFISENDEVTSMIEFMPKDQFLNEVKAYISTVDSNEILDTDSNIISFYIVGKILFGNTNFYKFSLTTDSKKFDGDETITFADKLSRRDYIFVAAVEMLTETVLEGIRAK